MIPPKLCRDIDDSIIHLPIRVEQLCISSLHFSVPLLFPGLACIFVLSIYNFSSISFHFIPNATCNSLPSFLTSVLLLLPLNAFSKSSLPTPSSHAFQSIPSFCKFPFLYSGRPSLSSPAFPFLPSIYIPVPPPLSLKHLVAVLYPYFLLLQFQLHSSSSFHFCLAFCSYFTLCYFTFIPVSVTLFCYCFLFSNSASTILLYICLSIFSFSVFIPVALSIHAFHIICL